MMRRSTAETVTEIKEKATAETDTKRTGIDQIERISDPQSYRHNTKARRIIRVRITDRSGQIQTEQQKTGIAPDYSVTTSVLGHDARYHEDGYKTQIPTHVEENKKEKFYSARTHMRIMTIQYSTEMLVHQYYTIVIHAISAI